MTNMVDREVATLSLRAGNILTVAIASGSALIERFKGDSLIDKTALSSGTRTFGSYNADVSVRISCITGTLSYSVSADVGSILSAPVQGALDPVTGGIKSFAVAGIGYASNGSAGDKRITVSNGALIVDGQYVSDFGVCAYALLVDYLNGTNENYLTELPLIAESGFRFVRVMGGPLWSSEWAATYGANKSLYFAKIKRFLDVAAANGLGIVLSVFWRHATQADRAGEAVAYSLGNPASNARAACATILGEYAAAFKDHPALAAWEVGNEYSLFAANGSQPTVNVPKGTPAEYTAADVPTLADMRSFHTFFATTLQATDTTGRIIMTGNGGSGGVIEKSIENYRTLVPLDNPSPVNTLTIHKYTRNEFGNRAYADLADLLSDMQALSKATGKPFILGEFGMERNETYGGYGGDAVFQTACQSIFNAGLQLSFCWNWAVNTSTGSANNFDFHPSNTVNGTNTKFLILQRFQQLARTRLFDARKYTPIAPAVRGGQNLHVPGAGLACLLTVADSASLKSAAGFAVAFWVRVTKDGLINRRIARKYGGNAGWYIGTDGNTPHAITCQVQYTDGATQNLGGQAFPQSVAHGWHHYVFQLNATAGQATTGLSVFEDGRWVKTLTPTAGKTWAASADSLLFFGDAGPSNVSYVGLKDFRLLNRALTDVEVRNLYLHDAVPIGTIGGEWGFDGVLTDSSGNANTAAITSGTPAYESFSK